MAADRDRQDHPPRIARARMRSDPSAYTFLWLLNGCFLFFSTPAEASSYEIAIAQTGGLSGTTMLCAEQGVCSAQLPIEPEGKPEVLTIIATTTPGNAYLRFKVDGASLLPGGFEYGYI